MKTTYQNRYGDNIIFEEINKSTIEMSGYDPEYIRYSYENDFSDAYEIYLLQCKALEEPDFNYLIEDTDENCIRPMNYQEFVQAMHDSRKAQIKFVIHDLWKHVKPDPEVLHMVDPSGGPYISVGMNVGRYFTDNIVRLIKVIKFTDNNKIKLTVKKFSK